jgi:putative membrane protein
MDLIESLRNIPGFLMYFGSSIVLTLIFSFIYTHLTPYKELDLIRQGNLAAVYSYGGALLGFIIPLSSAISHSVNIFDMAIWGIVAVIIQSITFFVVRLLFPTIVEDIPQNSVSHGIFLGLCSVSVGILNAACMSY